MRVRTEKRNIKECKQNECGDRERVRESCFLWRLTSLAETPFVTAQSYAKYWPHTDSHFTTAVVTRCHSNSAREERRVKLPAGNSLLCTATHTHTHTAQTNILRPSQLRLFISQPLFLLLPGESVFFCTSAITTSLLPEQTHLCGSCQVPPKSGPHHSQTSQLPVGQSLTAHNNITASNYTALITVQRWYNVMQSFSPLCCLALNEPVRLWIILSHGQLTLDKQHLLQDGQCNCRVSWVLWCGVVWSSRVQNGSLHL